MLGVLLLLGAVTVAVAGLPALRIQWLTPRLFAMFKRVSPKVSATERTALEAGTVAWDGELFSGRPQWNKLMAYRDDGLTEEERAFIDHQCSVAAGMCNAWEIAKERADLPEALWQYLKKERFFGMIIPKEYGGLGFSAKAQSLVLQKLSISETLMVTVGVPNSSALVSCCSSTAPRRRRITSCRAWPTAARSPVSASPGRVRVRTPPRCPTPASCASR